MASAVERLAQVPPRGRSGCSGGASVMWHFWNGSVWSEVTQDELEVLRPAIVCQRLAGTGALDPRLTIAVGDELSMAVAKAQHRRHRKTKR